MRYIVTSVIQSRDLSNPPATISWYQGENLGLALAALVSAGSSNESKDESNLPESMRYDVINVHMEMRPLKLVCPAY